MSHPRTTSRSVVARFLSRGPLERLPKRPDDREELLRVLAWLVLPSGESLDEPSLNLRLRAFTQDAALVRRALVDHRLLQRSADGARYDGVLPRPALRVEPAGEADDAEVNRVTVASYLGAGHFPDAREGYMAHIAGAAAARREEALTLVARLGGLVAGAVTIAEHGGRWADVALADEVEFRLLVVDPLVQRGGIGRALVAAVVDRARGVPGISRVVLTTNASWGGAIALYETLGFTHQPERDWHPSQVPEVTLRVYSMPV